MSNIKLFFVSILDLREENRHLADHMGSNVITSAQVSFIYFFQTISWKYLIYLS